RTNDRAIGLRAKREWHHSGRHRRRRPRRRATWRALWIVRVARLAGTEIGEFGGNSLADNHCPRRAQFRNYGCVIVRSASRKQRRAALGWPVCRFNDVLDRYGYTVQWANRSAASAPVIALPRLRQRELRVEMRESFNGVLSRRDPVEARARDLLGRNRAARDFSRSLRGGQRR